MDQYEFLAGLGVPDAVLKQLMAHRGAGLAGAAGATATPAENGAADAAGALQDGATSFAGPAPVAAGPGKFIMPGTPIPRTPVERKAPNPGWGGSFSDDSSITFDAIAILYDQTGMVRDQTAVNPSGSVDIDAGHSGELRLSLTIEGSEDNLPIPVVGGNDSFTQEAEGVWDVAADAKGALKITRRSFHMAGPSSNDTDYSVQAIAPAEDEGKGMVTVNVVVVGKTTSSSSGWNVGGEAGEDKKGVSGGYERGKTKQTGPGTVQEMMSVKINVVNIPKAAPPPEPKGTVKIKEVTAIIDDEFVVGPFVVKSAADLDTKSGFDPGTAKHLKATSVEGAVYSLYSSLPEGTRNSIANGKLAGEEVGEGMKIEIHGYASNTDTQTKNFGLSLKRAQAVRDAFKSLGVPDNVFQDAHPHGEWETRDDKGMAPTDDKRREKESADWRKVVIKMRYTVTTQTGE